jgi:DNA-binding NarL/FixJ family response regulator
MTEREAQIIELHDAGAKPGEIARRLGLSLGYVAKIVKQLGPLDDGFVRRNRLAMQLGSHALLKALRREGFA